MLNTISYKLICLITFGFFSLIVHAQNSINSITGNVKDSDGEPYPGISIVLKSLPDSTIVAYSISDGDGNYKITFKNESEKFLLTTTGLQIKTQTKEISNTSQIQNFRLESKDITLKEVVFKSKKMWGNKDTINYAVTSFTSANDVVIGDVLKKLPGINMTDDGKIFYHGKAINKFYIENLDLLGGRYNIATQNVSVKDISTVQVLENHQSIKSSDVPSNEAAINLKLKEEAKGVLTIRGKLGLGGVPFLRETELVGMYFNKKQQNITTYKGNNIGQDLSYELRSFTGENRIGGINLLSANIPSPPSISERRYLFNNDNSFSFNNLFKTKTDQQLNINISYINGHEKRDSYENTQYYLPNDSVLVVDENMHGAKNRDKIDAEFKYEINSSTKYLSNITRIIGEWTNNVGIINNEINQRIKNPTIGFNNRLHWIKKSDDGKGVEYKTNIGYSTSPQTLTIQPGLYEDFLNGGIPYNILKQKTKNNNLYFDNQINLLNTIQFGKVSIEPNININVNAKNLISELYKNDSYISADSMNNDLQWLNVTGDVGFNVKYSVNNLKINLYAPLNLNYIHINNKTQENKNNQVRLYSSPSLWINYNLTDKWSVEGSYRFSQNTNDLSTLYTGYILTNYRSLNHYDNRLATSKGQNGNIALNYKDVFKMLFIEGSADFSKNKRDILYSQYYQDILVMTSVIDQKNTTKNISIRGYISKGFDLWNIITSLESVYGIYSSEELVQNTLLGYKNKSLNIVASVSITPTSWFNLKYKGIWNRSWGNIDGAEAFTPIRTFKNTMNGNFTIFKNLNLNLNLEHYYNNASPSNRYIFFTDLGLFYKWKDIRFSADFQNILNEDKYITTSYNNLSHYQNIYKIRGRNVLFTISMKLK